MENFFIKMFSSRVQLNKNGASKATSRIVGNMEEWFAVAKDYCMTPFFLPSWLCRNSILPFKAAICWFEGPVRCEAETGL